MSFPVCSSNHNDFSMVVEEKVFEANKKRKAVTYLIERTVQVFDIANRKCFCRIMREHFLDEHFIKGFYDETYTASINDFLGCEELGIIYINLIEKAQYVWVCFVENLSKKKPVAYKNVGTELIKTVVAKSFNLGWQGRVQLEAFCYAQPFYLSLGFQYENPGINPREIYAHVSTLFRINRFNFDDPYVVKARLILALDHGKTLEEVDEKFFNENWYESEDECPNFTIHKRLRIKFLQNTTGSKFIDNTGLGMQGMILTAEKAKVLLESIPKLEDIPKLESASNKKRA